jgi:hypothetical protein
VAFGKNLDETQQRAMYVATAVDQALKKYRLRNRFLSFNYRHSSMREEEFNSIIRNGDCLVMREHKKAGGMVAR